MLAVPVLGARGKQVAGSAAMVQKGSQNKRHALAQKKVGCRTSLKSCCFLGSLVVGMNEVCNLQSYDHIRCEHF